VRRSPLYFESVGTGEPVVFIHAGIADCRMWGDQVEAFATRYRVIRFDAQGFGRSPSIAEPSTRADDIYELLRSLEIERAHLIGVSMGGAAAVDFALTHPFMVGALVPVGAGLSGYVPHDPALVEWEDEQERRQEAALARGDIEAATDIDLEVWLAGPKRRLEDMDARLRERLRPMAREALARQAERTRAPQIDPPAARRLDQVRAPTLVMVGDCDVPLVLDIADLMAARIPAARKWIVHNAAHMLNMERPEEFNRVVFEFLQIHPLK
jgi:3-oxoadipate enol-lactonase